MQTTVLIEGLPSEMTVPAMAGLAEDFGRLSRVVVEHNGDEGLPEAICWITFERSKDASRAIRELDGQSLAGRCVAVRWAAEGIDPIENSSQRPPAANTRGFDPAGTGLARGMG